MNGQPVDGFMGALPEGQLREFLDKHLPAGEPTRRGGRAAGRGRRSMPQGRLEQLQHAVATNPADDDARFDYVKALLLAGRLAEARPPSSRWPARPPACAGSTRCSA